ncbi:MAG: LysR substrate-binding domain-containing protein [Gammaproteobacteria bacterium]|nr:LysR substrate-binding domain-containing protein [Gammaproteobacteria bacterium]
MKLQQLRYICEVARRGLNVSSAAERLHTAQSGISTQIRLLEEELNVQIFERHGKRLVSITPSGRTIIEMAERILCEAENIQQISEQLNDQSKGTLSIATIHAYANYSLPPLIKKFSSQYPGIQLRIHQGDPEQLVDMVLSRTADLAITTAPENVPDELIMLPYRTWKLAAITLPDHPLQNVKPLTLEALAAYPLVTYDYAFASRSSINTAFDEKGLMTNIALTAHDSDIIKTYVKLGLGVGLVARSSIDEDKDSDLRVIDASHLFQSGTTYICLHRGKHLREYVYTLINYLAPDITRDVIEKAVHGEEEEDIE